jgi:hypothetical protein
VRVWATVGRRCSGWMVPGWNCLSEMQEWGAVHLRGRHDNRIFKRGVSNVGNVRKGEYNPSSFLGSNTQHSLVYKPPLDHVSTLTMDFDRCPSRYYDPWSSFLRDHHDYPSPAPSLDLFATTDLTVAPFTPLESSIGPLRSSRRHPSLRPSAHGRPWSLKDSAVCSSISPFLHHSVRF